MNNGNQITPEELRALMDEYEVKVIDLRHPEDYEEGHLKGAKLINLSKSHFAFEIDELCKSNTYVVYDENGENSNSAVSLMKQKGFEQVRKLWGGIKAWRENGYEVV